MALGRKSRKKLKSSHKVLRGRGFSLIELIISMVILAFAALSMMQLFSNLGTQQVGSDHRRTASLLAHELMEEIGSKRFDELTAKNAGNWSVIGIDTGESSSDKSTFDDVDDFNGWTENLTGNFSGFTRTATVIYVTSANLNPGSSQPVTNDYKRVNVQVTNSSVVRANVTTIVSAVKV